MVKLLVSITCKFLELDSRKDYHLKGERETFLLIGRPFGSGFPKLKKYP